MVARLVEQCPVCGANDWAPRERVGSATIERRALCDVGRTSPMPDGSDQDYGRADGAELRSASWMLWRKFARAQLDMLDRFRHGSLERRRLVDIGSSVGIFVAEAQARGWRAVGFEPDRDACYLTRNRGSIVNSFFGPMSVRSASVDMVVMSHVLEHVRDPIGLLTDVKNALADNGHVLVICPNSSGWIARVQGSRWYGYAVMQHMWHFNSAALARLIERAGYEIVEVDAKRAMHYRSPVLPSLTQPVLDIGLWVVSRMGQGDEVAVVGRKRAVPPGRRTGVMDACQRG